MRHEILYERAINFIRNDELDEAMMLLVEWVLCKETISLSARLKSLNNEMNHGTISNEDKTRERNKIRDSLLSFCNNLLDKAQYFADSINYQEIDEFSDGNVITEVTTLEIEIKINKDFKTYSKEEQQKLLNAIANILEINGNIKIKNIKEGSVLLTIELTEKQYQRLRIAVNVGELDRFDVVDIKISPNKTIDGSKNEDLNNQIRTNLGLFGKYGIIGEGRYGLSSILKNQHVNRIVIEGKDLICWSISDYFGLANHPEVHKADAEDAMDWSPFSVPIDTRIMSYERKLYKELEINLAKFVGKEDCCLFYSAFQSWMYIIQSLLTQNDVVIYDEENEVGIIDALRLNKCRVIASTHNDINNLVKNLDYANEITKETGGSVLVITEGVFGMRGDQGKLREITALKEIYNFRLLVNDSYGFGMLGATGAGSMEEQGVINNVDLYCSTFSKSMASIGAFFAGPIETIQFLRENINPRILLPMKFIKGTIKRFELLQSQSQLREKLWQNARLLQSGLKERGFNIGDTNTFITPIYLHGEMYEAMALIKDLRDKYGVFCSIIVFPAVPKGIIMLRLIPTAFHTDEDILITLNALSAILFKLQTGIYRNDLDT